MNKHTNYWTNTSNFSLRLSSCHFTLQFSSVFTLTHEICCSKHATLAVSWKWSMWLLLVVWRKQCISLYQHMYDVGCISTAIHMIILYHTYDYTGCYSIKIMHLSHSSTLFSYLTKISSNTLSINCPSPQMLCQGHNITAHTGNSASMYWAKRHILQQKLVSICAVTGPHFNSQRLDLKPRSFQTQCTHGDLCCWPCTLCTSRRGNSSICDNLWARWGHVVQCTEVVQ